MLLVECCDFVHVCIEVLWLGAVVLGRVVMMLPGGCWLLRALICKSRAKFFSSFLSLSVSVSPPLSLPPLIIIHGEHKFTDKVNKT
jgi:hypothetical protein